MEQEIITIILHKMYNHKIQKLYEEETTSFDFPEHINIDKIPFNILYDFKEQHYEAYKNILIENAFIYSYLVNDNNFKDYFIESINEIDDKIEDDIFFQMKICEYGIKHTFNKTYDKNTDESKIREEYKNIFKVLENKDTKLYSITNIYRKFIIDYLKNFKDDFEIVLDEILSTTNIDKDLINCSNGLLNESNIKNFKSILYRLILTDNFIYIENVLNAGDEYDYLFEPEIVTKDSFKDYSRTKFKDDEFDEDEVEDEYDEEYDEDEHLNEFEDKEYTEEDIKQDQEIVNEININIMNYIKECIENDRYLLPKDDEIRYNLYSIFFTYNDYDTDRKLDIENISENKESIKALKKLNPLYLMDLING